MESIEWINAAFKSWVPLDFKNEHTVKVDNIQGS